MSVEKWWNEMCGRGKREKPREKVTQTPFRPPRNPHGVTETRTRDPSGGRRASNRVSHEAAVNIIFNFFLFYAFFCKVKNNRDIEGVTDLLPLLQTKKYRPKESRFFRMS